MSLVAEPNIMPFHAVEEPVRPQLFKLRATHPADYQEQPEPARFGPGQPVVLVSADHRDGWRLESGKLVAAQLPGECEIERGIEAVAGEVDDLLAELAPYSAVTLPSTLRSSVAH